MYVWYDKIGQIFAYYWQNNAIADKFTLHNKMLSLHTHTRYAHVTSEAWETVIEADFFSFQFSSATKFT